MKQRHFFRGLTALLVLVMMLSAMVTTAFAAETAVPYSNADLYFFKVAPISSSFAQTSTAAKENSTPAWLRIDSMTTEDQVRVRIVGSSKTNHACSTSVYNFGEGDPTCSYCTRCTTKGSWVPYVRCSKGTNYAISSVVYERGYAYSSIGFQSTSLENTQTVSGYWSADSTGSGYEQPDSP